MPNDSRTALMGIIVLAGRELTAPQLIQLAATVGLSATNVKSHLTRMVSEGALERRGPARLATYRISAEQSRAMEAMRARLAHRVEEHWDGSWLLVALELPRGRGERDRLRAALWFDGFRALHPEVFVRPAWPLPWAEEQARQYSGACMRGTILSAPGDLNALYDLDGLDSEAGRLAAQLRRKIGAAISPRAAFAARIQLGGEVVHLAAHDPRVPPEMWDGRRGIAGLIEAFADFERCLAAPSQAFLDALQSRG